MHLIVVHYHWRPGGVRQVVENALPALAADTCLGLQSITLAAGHPPPPSWAQTVRNLTGATVPVRWVSDPLLAYVAEWPDGPSDRTADVAAAATRLIESVPEPRVVLLENPAVGRHPLIGRGVAAACRTTGTRLVCHHHDFLVDGRWERWPEWQACGIDSLDQALAAAVPTGPGVSHLTLSRRDAAWLAPRGPAAFCPNEVPRPATPRLEEIAQAREWLTQALGTEAPVWLLPCRLLRRKNAAEAVLLARLLAPDAIVATTGAASAASEAPYAAAIAAAAKRGRWKLRCGLLAGAEAAGQPAPAVATLMAASAAVVITSLFEGFGLPVMEAAALRLPCLARRQACPEGLAPATATAYDDIRVPRALAGGASEQARQEKAWARWRAVMPPELSRLLPEPPWWAGPGPLAFSRLTLPGQWEVLHACQARGTAEALLALNPELAAPACPAPSAPAVPDPMPPAPAAVTLATALAGPPAPSLDAELPSDEGNRALADRLAWANYYPLLWPGGDEPAD